MPARKACALKLFCDELSELTSKIFGVYIRDIPATSLPKKSLSVNLSPNDACLGIRSPKSYANAIKSRNPNTHFNTKSDHLNSTRHNSSKEHADDRLFLRLSNDNSLRAYSGFALLDYIKSELGSDKDLIKDDSISDAISSATEANPASISPSKDNAEFPDSMSNIWIVRLPEAHNRLPRVLFLFGCRTTTHVLPCRTTTPQCTRFWLWQNSRVCASSSRCRFCGSSQHSEPEYASHCAAGSGHICPPKYIHCHGPHPADVPKCELRPNPFRAPKSTTQIVAIRQISAEARLCIQADAGCIKPGSKKVLNDAVEKNQGTAYNHILPRSQTNIVNSSSPRITRSTNLFEVLR
ncbi:hypothetical protein EPUL_005528 [Erysiphe pulchra]|uniref:Uncharacterized protein n=1 Tax=Erysiphe pulchra TaxID=225359 RepID=A0A2S4PRF6_9PEZI|nr:hypothetical protein EPUL_005528 [Erysiphe pulchra]